MNYTEQRVALSCSHHDFLASNPYNKISIFKETMVVVTTFFASVVCLLISKVPPVRRRNNFQQMSAFQRSGIIGIRGCGFSLREIGRRLGIHHSTPSRICRTWSEEGLCQHLQGAGRPRITTNHEDRPLRYMTTRDKVQSTASVGIEWRRALGPKISISTIYRRKTLLDYMFMAFIREFR
jgi:transposase